MLEKIKSTIKDPRVKQFRDIRVVGLTVFGVIVLLISWSGVGVIETNYQLQKQVASLRQRVDVLRLQNENMKLENQYYSSDQYLELMAREQLNKGLADEKLLLIPKSVALAHTVEPAAATQAEVPKQTSNKPLYQKNLEAWRDFVLHKKS